MDRGLASSSKLPWLAITTLTAAAAAGAAVQAYLLDSYLTLPALLIVAAAVYAEAKRESAASRWLRRHYWAVSSAVFGAMAGSFIAPFINPGFTMRPFHYLLIAILAAAWLAIAIGILRRPGRANSEDPRR
jgi:hypothetical protein